MIRLLLLLALAVAALAQDKPVEQPDVYGRIGRTYPAPAKVEREPLDFLKLQYSGPAAFIIASVAESKTSWEFTGPVTGKQYTVDLKTRLAVTGGIVGGALVAAHYVPRWRKVIHVGLAITAGALAGKAYAQSRMQ